MYCSAIWVWGDPTLICWSVLSKQRAIHTIKIREIAQYQTRPNHLVASCIRIDLLYWHFQWWFFNSGIFYFVSTCHSYSVHVHLSLRRNLLENIDNKTVPYLRTKAAWLSSDQWVLDTRAIFSNYRLCFFRQKFGIVSLLLHPPGVAKPTHRPCLTSRDRMERRLALYWNGVLAFFV